MRNTWLSQLHPIIYIYITIFCLHVGWASIRSPILDNKFSWNNIFTSSVSKQEESFYVGETNEREWGGFIMTKKMQLFNEVDPVLSHPVTSLPADLLWHKLTSRDWQAEEAVTTARACYIKSCNGERVVKQCVCVCVCSYWSLGTMWWDESLSTTVYDSVIRCSSVFGAT